MAKYNSSPFGNISGEVLGVVASSNKGIKFLRNKGKTADAKTAKQLARRAIYGEFCTLWDEKLNETIGQTGKDVYIKKELFREILGFTLKFSPSASELWLAVCPSDGTMSAPIFKETESIRKGDVGFTVYGDFLFPAVSNDTDFFLFSAYFGQTIFNNLAQVTRLVLYSGTVIASREQYAGNRIGNNDYMKTIGQQVYRSFWYVNKKTGQVSKPLLLACDDSGNVQKFYPFGK